LLSLTIVRLHSSVENEGKVGMGGRCGKNSRHGVTGPWRREGMSVMNDQYTNLKGVDEYPLYYERRGFESILRSGWLRTGDKATSCVLIG
jgi:hypothetical protein